MAKFIYRMQSILDIKEKMEEQAKNDFSRARLHLNEEEEKLKNLKDRKEAYEEQGRKLQEKGLNVRDIMDNRNAIERMKEFISRQQKAVNTAQAQLEEAREKLQNAMQESKTQTRLKEKAFEQFLKEENAKESKEIDELVSYTYGRKNNRI
ncbi:MAG: flagellar export protein FliJ [Suilimivivens sp.]